MRARKPRRSPAPKPMLSFLPLEDRVVPSGIPVGTHDHDHVQTVLTLAPSFSFTGTDGFLSGARAGDPKSLALSVVAEYAGKAGLLAGDVANPIVTDGYTSEVGGQSHVYLQQRYNGLPVLNTDLGVHFTATGELIALNGHFVPGLSASDGGAAAIPEPVLTPVDALSQAANLYGYTLTGAKVTSAQTGINRATELDAPSVSDLPVPAKLVYVYTGGADGVRPAWQVTFRTPDGEHWFDAAVDSQRGGVIFSSDWVDNFGTYKVLAFPDESPLESGLTQANEVNPFDAKWSPFGWHDTNGVAGPEFSDTRGNNVSAQLDLTNTNPTIATATSGGNRPDGGTNRVFANTYNFATGPTSNAQRAALVTNLFYANNMLHDVHAAYGFTEAAGNFQFKNYTGSGAAGDQVNADAQDASGSNNANFATPPDGTSGRMQMYRFTLTTPNTDSDIDNGIIIHEYGHGVSNRLTGGPGNSNALNALQSGGMGEGWSDFWALMLTQKSTDGKNDRYPIGTYVLGQDPATGNGIRGAPYDPSGSVYSFPLSINKMTFSDYGTTAGTAVHNTGARWASVLWDMNWLLIDKYGFDPDLTTGYNQAAAPGTPARAGNKLTLKLVTDALSLQPANPSFLQARDAILAADLALTGGVNRREIWTAFARRGLGFGATTASSNSGSVTTSFLLPAEALAAPGVVSQSPVKVTGPVGPSNLRVNFSEVMDPTTFNVAADVVSFTGPGGVDLKAAITGFSWQNSNTTLQINFASQTAQGRYTLVLGPNISAFDDGAAMDQNLNGTAGESTADRYTAAFNYDATDLTVLAVTPVAGAQVDPTVTTVDFTFSEPIDPATLSKADLQVAYGTVTGVTLVSPAVARFTFSGLDTFGDVRQYMTVKHGAVADAFGYGNLKFNTDFLVDIATTAFPVPLPVVGAAGQLAHMGSYAPNPQIGTSIDSDSFTIDLEAGAVISVAVDQVTTLRPVVSLINAANLTVATFTSPAAGTPAFLNGYIVPAAGTYTIRVNGAAGTTGFYRVGVLANALLEAEYLGGASNNVNAQPLLGGVIGLTPGADAVTVQGRLDGGGVEDFFSLPLAAGQTVSLALAQLTGAGATLDLFEPTGTTSLIAGAGGATNYGKTIENFVTPADGLYLVRVVGGLGDAYQLSVSRGGVFDREANDTRPTAQPLGKAKAAVGGITAGNDDWYAVNATVGDLIKLDTITPGDGAGEPVNLLDPMVELYDPTGVLVAADDNSAADGRNAALGFFSPVNGTYTIRVVGAGATAGEYALGVTVAPNAGPATVSAGGPYTISEGGTVTLAASATDPEGDPLTFSWDLNNDGTFGDAAGANPVVTWVMVQALGVTDGPGGLTAKVRAADPFHPAVVSPTVALDVTNTAPTATAANGGAVPEGGTGLVTLNAPFDPSGPDTAAGFKYAYDFDSDGKWELGDGTYANGVAAASATVPAAYLLDSPGPAKVTARIIDKDGGATDYVVAIPVTNVDPTATFADATVAEGAVAGVTAPFDPSPADTAAGFRYSFDIGNDGTWEVGNGTYKGSGTTATLPPGLTANGPSSFVAKARVIDQDGGFTDYVATFVVDNVAPTAKFTAPATVPEGGSATVAFGSLFDPSPVDLAAGLRYSYDFDNNGTWDVGGGDYAGGVATASVAVPAALLANGPITRLVKARVSDQNDGFTDYTATIKVLNVAPTAAFAATAKSVPEGGAAGLVVTGVTDPSASDSAAGFRYAYDFDNDGTWDSGNGTYQGSAAAGSTVDIPAKYLADGPVTLTAKVRVIDVNGGFTEYTTAVAVTNAAPSATLTNTGPVVIGNPVGVAFENPTDPSAADAAAGFTYSFDFNNDGDFADAGDVAGAASPAANFSFAAPGAYTVRGRVADRDGGFADFTTGVVVSNVGPTATITATGPVAEGQTATVSLANATHPSPASAAAGFRYSYDFDNDGTFDLGNGTYAGSGTAASATVPAKYLSDGPGSRTVRARVVEVSGGFTDYTATIKVLNAAPTATFASAGPVAVGASSKVAFTSPADASATDALAGFRYSFDFDNDGSFSSPGDVLDGSSPSAGRVFRNPGSYTVRGRITDRDGGFTDFTTVVTVTNVAPTANFSPSLTAVVEGQAFNLRFGGATHPGADANAAGLRYSYDFDGDGKWDSGDGTYTGSVTNAVAAVPANSADGPATRAVRGRVIEVNGLFTDYSAAVDVANAPPTATLAGPAGSVTTATAFTVTFQNPTDPSAADQEAGLRFSYDFNNDGNFTSPGDVANSPLPSAQYAFPDPGTYTVRARVEDRDGAFTDLTLPVTVVTPPPAGVGQDWYAAGADAGGSPLVRMFDASGAEKFSGPAFEGDFTGGVRVATGDVTGDGVPDLVVGSGPGRMTLVRVIDGATGTEVYAQMPFEETFTGGTYVAVGDVDADGFADVAVTPDEGGGPRVRVFGGKQGFDPIADYFGIDDPDFRGGARAAFGDVNADGRADLVVAAGFGGGPRVSVWDGRSVAAGFPTTLFNDFFVFEQTLRNGVFVTAGDIDGDGFAEVIVGGGPGGGPRVFALSGAGLLAGRQDVRANFFAGDPDNRGGIRVTATDLDGDDRIDILTGSGSGAGTRLTGYSGIDLSQDRSLDAFPGFTGGVFVG